MSKKSHKKSSKPRRPGPTGPKSPGATGARTPAKTATKAGAGRTPAAKSPAKAKTGSRQAKPKTPRPNEGAKAAPKANSGLLTEGTRAPAFQLPRDGGGMVSLQDFKGRKLVLFFYPKANTPGCTREAADFTRLADAFAAAGAAVLGVSADSIRAQDSFRDKHDLKVPLLSDEARVMIEAYGAWGEKSLYGRKFMGIIRSTILVDAAGKIARIWRNVKVDGHADEVLAATRAL